MKIKMTSLTLDKPQLLIPDEYFYNAYTSVIYELMMTNT